MKNEENEIDLWRCNLKHLCLLFGKMRLVRENMRDWTNGVLFPTEANENTTESDLKIATRLDAVLDHLSFAEAELDFIWKELELYK